MRACLSICAVGLSSIVAWFGLSTPVSAQVFAHDEAAGYTGWATGTNHGFGFGPWTLVQTGTGNGNYTGFFVGNGSQNPTPIASSNGASWGLYANGASGTNAAVAYRSFTNSLATNTVFKVKWHARGIGFSPTNRGGFCLRNGSASTSPADYNTGVRFEFFYAGGGGDTFQIRDGTGVNPAGLGFGAGPFQLEFTLLTSDTYRLVIKDPTGTSTLTNYDNLLLDGSGTIDSVALYAFQTDGDQMFNALEIASTSLIPPDIQIVTPTNRVYVSTASTVSFDVVSAFSTVATNAIALTLNGVKQTNLAYSGSATNWHVSVNSALSPNATYAASITAMDANGNRATNSFNFNTWLASNPFIEAEDYNFSGGAWIDNFQAPQPNQAYTSYSGVNGIDYLEYDLSGTMNLFRPGDLPQVEPAADVDHANFAANGFGDYNLAFVQNGEWLDYTRRMSNMPYAVYARMAGFGANPVMLIERLDSPTAISSNQPRVALGTFVCPPTGGVQSYAFVPLKDMLGNPVLVQFPETNTFRLTCIGSSGSYNFTYLTLVPSTNTSTLGPYISSGFPFPGAGPVMPDQALSFTIANRTTSVTPDTIQLFLNSNNVTSGVVPSNSAAGTVVTYVPPTLLPPGTNTIQIIFGDGSVSQTNQWQFTVSALPVLPTSFAVPASLGGAPGFAIRLAKARDNAPASDFLPSIDRALRHIAGAIIDASTGQPYTNLAAGPNRDGSYVETNTINYDINATASGNSTFTNKSPFPYMPPSGTNNFISLVATMYLQLSPGVHTFAVRSDDGFQLAAGATLGSTNLLLGIFDAGRGDNVPTTFSFIVQSNGLYPMQLVYDQGEFGGNIEFYSINQTGQNTLINDPVNPNAIKAYRALLRVEDFVHTGSVSAFSFYTQTGLTYTVQSKDSLNETSWFPLAIVTGNGLVTNITDSTANSTNRFYRLSIP